MYPVRRQALDYWRGARMSRLAPGETHVNRMRAWPWDIDPFGDLNNGRIVTLSDVGRITLFGRMGVIAAMKRRRWGLAMAGSIPHYRKRVTMWTPLEWRSRCIGRCDRFVYIDHQLHARGAAAAQVMCRVVMTEKGAIADPAALFAEIGHADWNPVLPDWVEGWRAADALRPWPPQAI